MFKRACRSVAHYAFLSAQYIGIAAGYCYLWWPGDAETLSHAEAELTEVFCGGEQR